MRSIKELIYESLTLKLSKEPKIKTTSSYTEITWFDLGVEFKKSYQKILVDGYLESVKRNHYDESDKKSEIRQWQNNPYEFNRFSAKIIQFGSDKPVLSLTIHGIDPKDDFNSFKTVIASIRLDNDKIKYSEEELIKLANNVFKQLTDKTDKVIKYLAKNWTVTNEYISYNDIINL